jgi:hypothetical protein
VERLLAMVASFPEIGPEEAHGENRPSEALGGAIGAAHAASRGIHRGEHRDEGCPPAKGMADTGAEEQDLGEGEMGSSDARGGL